MRPLHWLALMILAGAPGGLYAQAEAPARSKPMPAWGAHPVPLALALGSQAGAGSTSHRPFFLPRPGEHTAYWVGLAAGLAVSPLLWCDDCSTVSNASTSLLLGLGGAVTALLLQRTF